MPYWAHIPEGFATLLLAFATIVTSLCVLIAALVAWRGVQQQIKSAAEIETKRQSNEASALENGFAAELIFYSSELIYFVSIWNRRVAHPVERVLQAPWPEFPDPLFFKANAHNIGHLPQSATFALVEFYSLLLDFNDRAAKERRERDTWERAVARLRTMAANISRALHALPDHDTPPPMPDIDLDGLYMPDGKPVSQAESPPRNLLDLLLALAGPTPSKIRDPFPSSF